VADRADHPKLRVGPGRRCREGAAPRVTVEKPFLHEDVERLPDGRPAHLEPLAERVLGGDALALAAQVLADRVGDLEIPGNPGTVVHPLGLRCHDVSTSSTVAPGSSNRPLAARAYAGDAGAARASIASTSSSVTGEKSR